MNLTDKIKKIIKEATGESGSKGSYILPMQPGVRLFDKSQLGPFTDAVSKYDDAELEYDSYDGQMSTPKKKIKKMEKEALKIAKWKKKHPIMNDDDGDNINPLLRPLQKKIDMKIVSKPYEPVNEWVEITDDIIAEDLAVWFGTKKKPKGSSQPKGPWVNICKKIDGKHPPCGRSEATDKAYPKCRAAGVAGKMSDSQKKAACSQKRKAEKTHSKSGTGNKPKMVSYKPRKSQNESLVENLVRRVLKEQENKKYNYMFKKDPTSGISDVYFLKKGNTYDVYTQNEDGTFSKTNMKLPLAQELQFKKVGNNIVNDGGAVVANQIAKKIKGDSDQNWVVFTDKMGYPVLGTLEWGKYIPVKDLVKMGKKEKPNKENETFSFDEFVSVGKGFGLSPKITNSTEATVSTI